MNSHKEPCLCLAIEQSSPCLIISLICAVRLILNNWFWGVCLSTRRAVKTGTVTRKNNRLEEIYNSAQGTNKWPKANSSRMYKWLLQEMRLVMLTNITARLLMWQTWQRNVSLSLSASLQPDLFLPDKIAVVTPDHIVGLVLWSLTPCQTCLFKVPRDTGDAIKYDPQIKEVRHFVAAVRWVMLSLCAFPFTQSLPLWCLQTRSPHAYVYISLSPLLRGCGRSVTSV